MKQYIYNGQELNHTDFISLCRSNGVNGGRKESHYEKLVAMAKDGNERAIGILNNLEVREVEKRQHGGSRPGAGRPANDRNIMVGVRLSQAAVDKLNRLTTNKSEYIENLIKQQPEP